MAAAFRPKKPITCVENLPEYQKLKTNEYIPFNLEEEASAENEFYTDKDTSVDGPALFSTRGTLYEKRSAPEVVDLTATESGIPSTRYSHVVKVIAARFRKDFALECKAVDESSWKNLSYYFDDLDIYHWGFKLLQQVLSCIAEENSTLHNRILRFAVYLLATDTPRARQLSYFGRAIWFYEEVDYYGEDFLEETVKFMTHRSDVIEKLTACAVKYLEEAKGDSYMPLMWYDDSFKKLTEARARRLYNPTRMPVILKHKIAAPLAPTLGYNAEKLHASGHHRRTSSLEKHKDAVEDNDDRKSDTVIDHQMVDNEIKYNERENFTETGTVIRGKNTQILNKKPGNQRQFSGEDGSLSHDQKKPNTGNFNGRRAVAEPQRSSSDSKHSKNKKKGHNNKHRESGLRDDLRISSSPANVHNSRLGHTSKPSTSRSIFDEDDSIISVTIDGEKRDSPNHSPEIPMADLSIQPSRGSQDSYRAISNPSINGVRFTGQSQFTKIMHPYGQLSFPESGQQPWYQGPFGPPPNHNGTSYMIMPNVETGPVPNQYAQWGPVHSLPSMPPTQPYGQMVNTPFYDLMQQDLTPYYPQYDPMAAAFQPHSQTFQPYQPESHYDRKEQHKRYPDHIRSSHRRWNFAARNHRREFSRDMSSEFVEPAIEFTDKISPRYGTVTQHDTNVNHGGDMAQSTMNAINDQGYHAYEEFTSVPYQENDSDLLAVESVPFTTTGVHTESITVGEILQVEEKRDETGIASAPGFQYPMVYPRVDSNGHVEKAVKEIIDLPNKPPSENKETAAPLHQDYRDTQSQDLAPAQAQRVTLETPTKTIHSNGRKSVTSEHKPEDSKVIESGSGSSQAAKMMILGPTSQRLPRSALPQGHQHNYRSGNTDPLKLYVTGVNLTDEAVVKIFEPYRPVHVTVTRPYKKWNTSGMSMTWNNGMRFAFVTFASANECVMVREALSGTVQRGIKLRVNPAYMKGPMDSTTERVSNLLENPAVQRSETVASNYNTKSGRVATPIQIPQATATQEHRMVPTEDVEQESGDLVTIDPAIASSGVLDHPPVQSRFKKNKNKQKKKPKHPSRDTSIRSVDETTVDPASSGSSSNSLGEQNQSCTASVQDSFNSNPFKDGLDTKKTTQVASPAKLSESLQNSPTLIPESSHELTGGIEGCKDNAIKNLDRTQNNPEPTYEEDGLNQPPSSPIDIVMTDLPDVHATEFSRSTAKQQIDMTDDHTSDDSGLSYLSAPESSQISNGDPVKFDVLLDNSEEVERTMEQHHSGANAQNDAPKGSHEQSMSINDQLESVAVDESQGEDSASRDHGLEVTTVGSSAVSKATQDKKPEDDDDTKGWDKSVKINTKGSRKKRRKTKSNSSQSIKTSIEANHGNQANSSSPTDSTKQDQTTAEGSHSPESVKSKKST